jgi:hypothetical protein
VLRRGRSKTAGPGVARVGPPCQSGQEARTTTPSLVPRYSPVSSIGGFAGRVRFSYHQSTKIPTGRQSQAEIVKFRPAGRNSAIIDLTFNLALVLALKGEKTRSKGA